MTVEEPAKSRSGMSRGWKLLLAVSLALNLAVVGIIAGSALKFSRDGGRSFAARDTAFGPFTEALSSDQRRALLRGMSDRGVALRQAREDFRNDIGALVEALQQEPFDVEAFKTLLLQQGERVETRANEGRLALTDLVAQMSADERKAFAERLSRALSDRHKRRN